MGRAEELALYCSLLEGPRKVWRKGSFSGPESGRVWIIGQVDPRDWRIHYVLSTHTDPRVDSEGWDKSPSYHDKDPDNNRGAAWRQELRSLKLSIHRVVLEETDVRSKVERQALRYYWVRVLRDAGNELYNTRQLRDLAQMGL